jgi:cytochrome P450
MTDATGDRDAAVNRLAARFDHFDPELTADVLPGVYEVLLAKKGFSYSEAHGGMHLATHYSDLRTVERLCPPFSSAQGTTHPRQVGTSGNIPIDFDAPEHTQYRELFNIPLAPQSVRDFESQIRDLTVELLEAFEKEAEGDFVELVARPLPLLAIGAMLGWDRATNDQVVEHATKILELYGTPEVLEHFQKFDALTLDTIHDRQRCPRDDYLSTLTGAKFNDRPLSEEELSNIVRVFLFAGFETTTNSISQLLLHLARHPEIQDELRAKPELIDAAVDEGLRMFTPVHTMFRTVTEPTSVGDTSFEVGDKVALLFSAANHDPEKYPNPYTFDMQRPNLRGHVSFGFGAHFCAGAHLARAEIRILLEELSKRPNIELTGDPTYLPHLMIGQMMGLEHLPLRFAEEK